jgi:hypothetical protein
MTWKGPVMIGILGGPLEDGATLAARRIAVGGTQVSPLNAPTVAQFFGTGAVFAGSDLTLMPAKQRHDPSHGTVGIP